MKLRFPSMLSRASQLENQLDDFFDKVVVATLIFRNSLELYLNHGICDEYREKLREVETIESKADQLRRDIEVALYHHTLIPELRSDVLALLEEVDKLINRVEACLFKFEIEQPQFPEQHKESVRRLLQTVCECMDQIIYACRAFFRDQNSVKDYSAQVQWLESEADKLSTSLLRAVFRDEQLDLAQRIHLRYFVERIDDLANAAEDISDSLTIYAIKRGI
ncbi:DUF47 domain-containing protein [Oceanospirillum sediminis]|uniref:DUF47 family protein n=1 Tax=Oceanospirillum sediminis TaxID=2760088 RepID=A0A839IPH1_9GAMM|nr:DUF47 family protein [Oceanospirillum sediminis]MBB1486146.1 DUF47 family protein [Oceanospirillum sediminis]